MKGILLAGGSGTRMHPMTLGVNKHLLPIGAKPMILHPLQKLAEFGVKEILLITGPEHLTQFAHLLGDGSSFGINLHFRVQQKPGGIAQALSLAQPFVGAESFFVILGDNLFGEPLQILKNQLPLKEDEALIVLKEVNDPSSFGIAHLKNGKIIDVVEKPKNPSGNLCVTGIYGYTPKVFDVIREIRPSGRGEMEISDVNRVYAQALRLKFHILKSWWIDAGTLKAYQEANQIFLRGEL